MSNDCRNCRHNTYRTIDTDWFSCGHPVTLAKEPRWLPGEPLMIDFRTGDVPMRDIHMFKDCPTWEPARHE